MRIAYPGLGPIKRGADFLGQLGPAKRPQDIEIQAGGRGAIAKLISTMGALVKVELQLDRGEAIEVNLTYRYFDALKLEINHRVGLVAQKFKVFKENRPSI